jgi:hypothetical protein
MTQTLEPRVRNDVKDQLALNVDESVDRIVDNFLLVQKNTLFPVKIHGIVICPLAGFYYLGLNQINFFSQQQLEIDPDHYSVTCKKKGVCNDTVFSGQMMRLIY